MGGVVLQRTHNQQWTNCCREVIPKHDYRKGKLVAEMIDERRAAEVGNKVVVAFVVDTAPIDTMSPKMLGRRGQAAADPDIQIRLRHYQNRDAHSMRIDAAAEDTDVRTRLVVGKECWDGKVRRGGDACDSLVLVDEEAVEGLAHHIQDLGIDD